MPIAKCSYPGCDKTLTRGLDTYGPHDRPLCREHRWYEFDQARAEVAKTVEKRAAELNEATQAPLTWGDA